jgi:hypothetical protein
LIDLKTWAVAPFLPDARTFHNIYKLQKHVLLRCQSYLIVSMGYKNLRFWPFKHRCFKMFKYMYFLSIRTRCWYLFSFNLKKIFLHPCGINKTWKASITMSKSSKKLPNCLKWAETNIILIVFNGVICSVSACTVTISFCSSTWIRYQKSFIRSMTKWHWRLFEPFICIWNHTIGG